MARNIREYPDGTSDSEYVLTAGSSVVTVSPKGAHITSWQFNGADILYTGSSKKRSGIPLLFPYFGKSTMGRQHGFGRDNTWQVVEESDSALSLLLTDKDIDDTARAEYPYPFSAGVDVSYDEHGSLVFLLSVSNTGEKDMPISPGLHPYWAVAHEQKSQIKIIGVDDFDPLFPNWDTEPPDTDFTCDSSVVLGFPTHSVTITDKSDPKAMNGITVWSQPKGAVDYNFVCFEPVCGPRGSIDSSPILLPPGAAWHMQIGFGVEML